MKKEIFKCQVTDRCFPFEQDVIGQIHNVEGMYLNHFGLQTEVDLGLFCGGLKLFFLLKTLIFLIELCTFPNGELCIGAEAN